MHSNEQSQHEDKAQNTVEVTINEKSVVIHRGRQRVAELKAAAGCQLAWELELVEDGKLVPLADDGAVTIKGGEKFICHPRDGASS